MSKYGVLRRGDVSKDGLVFWSYNNGGNEWWISTEDYLDRRQKEKQRQREWRKSESGSLAFRSALSRYRGSSKGQKTQKEYRQKYKERPHARSAACAKEGRRRAAKAKSQAGSCFEITFLYALCRAISKAGELHHVDHIIPLSRGGEHVTENLRIIPARANLSKGAKL